MSIVLVRDITELLRRDPQGVRKDAVGKGGDKVDQDIACYVARAQLQPMHNMGCDV